jgi:hypothetical protein
MKVKIGAFAVTLVFAIVAVTAVVIAGGTAQSKGGNLPTELQLVEGRIAFMERLGGYYIKGIDPPGDVMIDNQNQSTLQPLAKSGKVVQILGRFTIGADHLKIEKIDGKSYPVKKAAK